VAGDDPAGLIVHRGEHAYVLMNLYPYSNGHVMVAPYRHLAEPGDQDAAERAEIVSLRTTVTGLMKKPPLDKIRKGSGAPPKSAFSGKRKVSFDGRFRDAPTYRRAELLAGNKVSGPALIEEHASTTVLMPGDRMTVDAYGNLVIRVAGAK